jgi:cysteine synthase A
MVKVEDGCTFASMRAINQLLGRRVGGSTGTNFFAALKVMCDMVARGEKGSVVSLICDSGERYGNTYYSDRWLKDQGFSPGKADERIKSIIDGAQWME